MKIFNEFDIEINLPFTHDIVLSEIKQICTIQELTRFIHKNSFYLNMMTPPFGCLRSEQLLRCIELAQQYGTLDFIPDVLNLRTTLDRISTQPMSNTFSEGQIKQFYQERFQHLNILPHELDRLVRKIPLSMYLSLDVLVEDAVMALNLVHGVKTVQSCSGHKCGLRYFAFTNFVIRITSHEVSGDALKEKFIEALQDYDGYRMKLDIKKKDDDLEISMFHLPPADWIRENGKPSASTLHSQLIEFLSSGFNYCPGNDLNAPDPDVAIIQALDHIRIQTWKHVNALNDALDLPDHEDLKFWDIFKPRCLAIENMYSDFYSSDLARSIIAKFWNTIICIALSLRSKHEQDNH
ncbi:hypothetical protein K8T06_15785 [bacterium]|nr:hypothetical protein [bacterium]